MTHKSWQAWVTMNAPPSSIRPTSSSYTNFEWLQWQQNPVLWLAWHNRHAQWAQWNDVNTEWIPAQRVSTLMQLEVQLITWKLTGDWGPPDPLGIVGKEGETT